MSFEANLGQTDHSVKFLSRSSEYTLFLRANEADLALRNDKARKANDTPQRPKSRRSTANFFPPSFGPSKLEAEEINTSISRERNLRGQTCEALRMRLLGANRAAKVTGLDQLPGKSYYFVGADPKKWRTNVPTYAKVKYEGIYPGIDLFYYGRQQQLEYDFVIAPGADPNAISMEIGNRTSKISTDANGDLVVRQACGEVRLHKPSVYQPNGPKSGADHSSLAYLNAGFVVHNNRIRFDVASYDKTKPLIIDPVLVYSTYLGGSRTDWGNSIAVDSSGNTYVAGATRSTDFPTVNAGPPATRGGSEKTFVMKINPAGNTIMYSAYLGGSNNDIGSAIAVDSSGSVYVTGRTNSPDFPIANAVQPTLASPLGSNVFVTKFSPDGGTLVYSTYLGGSGSDQGNGIAIDASGHAFVTGVTQSPDFPTTSAAFQTTYGGNDDAFVAKLSVDGKGLVYSTHLGGSGNDQATAVALDASGNAYVTGTTLSFNFPTTQGAFESASNGGVFVTKLNANGTALVYSTYLGSAGDDARAIAVDSSGNAYITGGTTSPNFPTTISAFQSSSAGYGDAFVTKLNSAGVLVYSTYLGGSGDDLGYGIAVDSFGNSYVVGTTLSADFPAKHSMQSCAGAGGPDVFVSNLNAQGDALLYSTCLGGSDESQGRGIAVDSSGNAYITGFTFAGDFPLVNPLETGHGGEPDSDAFVAKIARGHAGWRQTAASNLR